MPKTKQLQVKTSRAQQVVDITEEVLALVEQMDKGANVCSIFVKHTTCAVTTADLDPGTDQDILDAVRAMILKLNYRHPHDPSHVWSHIASTIIGPSVSVPVIDGRLDLGTWQRIVLIELDGPRERQLVVSGLL